MRQLAINDAWMVFLLEFFALEQVLGGCLERNRFRVRTTSETKVSKVNFTLRK